MSHFWSTFWIKGRIEQIRWEGSASHNVLKAHKCVCSQKWMHTLASPHLVSISLLLKEGKCTCRRERGRKKEGGREGYNIKKKHLSGNPLEYHYNTNLFSTSFPFTVCVCVYNSPCVPPVTNGDMRSLPVTARLMSCTASKHTYTHISVHTSRLKRIMWLCLSNKTTVTAGLVSIWIRHAVLQPASNTGRWEKQEDREKREKW